MATFGWLSGCLVISLLGRGYFSAVGLRRSHRLATGERVHLFFLPQLETPKSVENLTWHERLGLDALTLLKNPDHRVIFIMAALFTMSIAGFYPYAPTHLRELGFVHTTAWMSFWQVTEMIAMFSPGPAPAALAFEMDHRLSA